MTRQFELDENIVPHSGQSNSEILFTCASFEPRCTAISENLTDEFNAEVGVIYYNTELKEFAPEKLKQSRKCLEEELSQYCETLRIVEGSINNPTILLKELRTMLEYADEYCNNINSATIDVTCFNREALLILFSLLNSWFPDAKFDILYVSPDEYGDWLSRGHKTIRNILGFTGEYKSDRSTALVILSGFEEDRTYKIVEELEPAVVQLGIGGDPTEEKFLERNKRRQQMIKNRQETETFRFPADDISETHNVVNNIVMENKNKYNIVLAPMSTKLSTIGCWKVACDHSTAQVIYALPAEYNYEGYSVGSKSVYSASFDGGL